VHLLKQALQEMQEHYDEQDFNEHLIWFQSLMERTQTISEEEKYIIEEVLKMQYQIDPIIRENRTVIAIAAESEAKGRIEGEITGEIKGLQEAILGLVSARFPALVISQVQQTIAPVQDTEQLKKFIRQLARVSDEQEVPALLAQSFPLQDEMKVRLEGKVKVLQETILDLISDRFPAPVISQAQQTIAPVQDTEQLKKFIRQLARVSDEQEVYALLAQCFPTH